MAHQNSFHTTQVRVLTDAVDLGGGFSLPRGDYQADVTMMHIPMRGKVHDQLGSVKITVTEEFLQSIGMPPSKGSAISYGVDVTKWVLSGDIVEV